MIQCLSLSWVLRRFLPDLVHFMRARRRILFLDVCRAACPGGHCDVLARTVAGSGCEHRYARTASPGDLKQFMPDLVVARPSPAESLASFCAQFRGQWPDVPLLVVFCGEWPGLREAAACLNDCIDDFSCCPVSAPEFEARVSRLLSLKPTGASRGSPVRQFLPGLVIGRSAAFLQSLDRLDAMAKSDATLLLSGETGTGKEVFARSVHYLSKRKGHPFVPVNCGSLPDNLIENELFGHAKGAYTDASSSEIGVLGMAERGTLFLDEVDALTAAAQAKLLRFLQDREYRPLGSARTLVADVRIVAATNADLRRRVRDHGFRQDLFYRLEVLSLHIPPLRDRLEDIPLLAECFLERHRSQSETTATRFSPAALQKLADYPWPGNIRELEAVVHRAAILAQRSVITFSDIELPVELPDSVDPSSRLREAKQHVIGEFERSYIAHLLSVHRGNISQAAREAGKERRAFQRLIRKYRLDRAKFCEA
jgi:DNA-binding NtrC family response regulator